MAIPAEDHDMCDVTRIVSHIEGDQWHQKEGELHEGVIAQTCGDRHRLSDEQSCDRIAAVNRTPLLWVCLAL